MARLKKNSETNKKKVHRAANRVRPSPYRQVKLRTHSHFRFIRARRRLTRTGEGVNLFTVKYLKDGKAYYLTTRSVPHTLQKQFKLPTGHSEQRYAAIRKPFEKRHGLEPHHVAWGATEREPCGFGPGMANCRKTLQKEAIPPERTFYASEYPAGSDMEQKPDETTTDWHTAASSYRQSENEELRQQIEKMDDVASDAESESNFVAEYESDYGEISAQRRKSKALPGKRRRGKNQRRRPRLRAKKG